MNGEKAGLNYELQTNHIRGHISHRTSQQCTFKKILIGNTRKLYQLRDIHYAGAAGIF